MPTRSPPPSRDASGFPYRVRDWKEMNHNLFSAIKLEKTVYFIVLLLIVLVAAFNIVATLVMVVMEKRRDIAVLKSMGATRGAIAQIFIYKGLVIGVVGTVVGSIAGLAPASCCARTGSRCPRTCSTSRPCR